MLTLSKQAFTELAEFSHPTCVSICIPTDALAPDPKINKTAFKNIVNKTIAQLHDLKITDNTRQSLEKKCEELVTDNEFWKQQDQSLILYAAGNVIKTFSLPSSESELLMISDHFYIVPLIPIMSLQVTFFVLELDKKHTRMWKGTNQELQVVNVPDLPKSVDEVTGQEVNERQLQFHTSTASSGAGKRPAVFHGSSSWQDDKERYLERFLQAVDKAVCTFLNNEPHPLYISAAEELSVMFHKISQCPTLEPETLTKVDDPKHRQSQLHKQALALTSATLEIEKAAAVKIFEEEPRSERKVTVLPEVVRQAYEGKVDTLLVSQDAKVWGIFEPETLSVILDDTQRPMSAEILNLAARLTLKNNGQVVVVPAEQMPVESSVAAILRY